jgi:hypothetical protein
MLFQLAEDLLAQGIGALGVDARVLDILAAQVVGHILNPAAGFQKMYRHGVAQGVDRALLDTGLLAVIGEELLHLALLQGPLAAGEQVRPHIPTLAQQFSGVTPQGLLSAESVL